MLFLSWTVVYGGLVLVRKTGTRSLRNIVYGGLVLVCSGL